MEFILEQKIDQRQRATTLKTKIAKEIVFCCFWVFNCINTRLTVGEGEGEAAGRTQ